METFGDRLEDLVAKIPTEMERYLMVERIKEQESRRRRHVAYQRSRTEAAETIIKARSEIDQAWGKQDIDLVIDWQRKLLDDSLDLEVIGQIRELWDWNMGPNDPDRLSKRRYLSRFNRHLREVASKLRQDALGTFDHTSRRRADKVLMVLNTITLLLNGDMGHSRTHIYKILRNCLEMAENALVKDEMLVQLRLRDSSDRDDEHAETDALIKKAEDVISKDDKALCKEIGNTLISIIDSKPPARAVAMILLSNVFGGHRGMSYVNRGIDALEGSRPAVPGMEEVRI